MRITIILVLCLVLGISGALLFYHGANILIAQPIHRMMTPVAGSKPLDKYTINALSGQKRPGSAITIGKKIGEGAGFTSYIFYFTTEGKKESGELTVPRGRPTNGGVIAMARGYIAKEDYFIGDGSHHAAEYLAARGYVTLAPDFLGYGESDNPSQVALEERFQTYTTMLDLLASVKNLPAALQSASLTDIKPDVNKISLWGHSNGGQIILTTLTITGKQYPTVLWAPVSKPFPYSILYFTDDIEDHGKALRKVVATFEAEYDSEKYSMTNYLDRIKAPIQLNQGTADEAVPQAWSDTLENTLKAKKVDVEYHVYPGEDHDFSHGSWDQVAAVTEAFYTKHL
jgi:dipeptidyl aminopeptidase/acylaminoacyl peptidase